jgi:tetratricopeptide (TPR) repeat protein
VYYFFRQKNKVMVFGLLFFTFNIMFLLQILGAGQGFIADRFTYIAYWGLFFIYAYWFQWLLVQREKFRPLLYITTLVILGIYGFMNFQQNRIWKNGETLWTHVIKYNPGTALAWENRGSYYMDAGRIKAAIHDFTTALALKPDNAVAYYSRGNLYHYYIEADPSALRLALQDYNRAIRLSPGTPEYLVQRGVVSYKLGLFDEAIQDLNAAESFDPTSKDIYAYRSLAYINLGQNSRARADIEKYLDLNPYEPVMWANLGVLARKKEQYAKSLGALNRAIQLAPDTMDYFYKRARTYYEMGEIQQASNDMNFLQAKGFTGIDPDFARKVYKGK